MIPESESADVLKGAWKTVQDAVIMILRDFKQCKDSACKTCAMILNLTVSRSILEYKKQSKFASGILKVDQILSDWSLEFANFTRDTFSFDPNMPLLSLYYD